LRLNEAMLVSVLRLIVIHQIVVYPDDRPTCSHEEATNVSTRRDQTCD
jgi:hypothetical protein